MQNQEGVIKYQLHHQNQCLPPDISTTEINSWRSIFHTLGLIGQNQLRYDGYGFGNISQRYQSPEKISSQFIISGTQTGDKPHLSQSDFCLINEANPEKNFIRSTGEIKPSSEALTHASIYHQNPSTHAVIHVHDPSIWSNTSSLELPFTQANVPYGTPEMATAIAQLLKKQKSHQGIISLLGHEDGIVAYSDTLENAAILLILVYNQSIRLDQMNGHY